MEPVFSDPRTQILFEDINTTAKVATDLKLYNVASTLYFLMSAMMHSPEALNKLAAGASDALKFMEVE